MLCYIVRFQFNANHYSYSRGIRVSDSRAFAASSTDHPGSPDTFCLKTVAVNDTHSYKDRSRPLSCRVRETNRERERDGFLGNEKSVSDKKVVVAVIKFDELRAGTEAV